ncbi:MAG: hypothetical protein ABS79_02660 [Planctomycetes bacterium SCN 63-9]|nr:MAG: hypothetical protein ABS79_02660 [Planctomycetes bacterium SCN 63-9]
MIEVWVVELDRDDDGEPIDPPIDDLFGEILSDDERVRAKRLMRPKDRLRFARCRAAVRSILGQIEGVPPSSLRFGSGPHGKPHLEPPSGNRTPTPVDFNVSHSGGLAVVAATRGRALGIDVEQIRRIREADRIVETFFTEVERAQYMSIADHGRDAAFMRGWTRKEAILKGLGKGLVGGPANYETMFGTSDLSFRFQPANPYPIVSGWRLWEAAVGDGYVATLAAAVDRER